MSALGNLIKIDNEMQSALAKNNLVRQSGPPFGRTRPVASSGRSFF